MLQWGTDLGLSTIRKQLHPSSGADPQLRRQRTDPLIFAEVFNEHLPALLQLLESISFASLFDFPPFPINLRRPAVENKREMCCERGMDLAHGKLMRCSFL